MHHYDFTVVWRTEIQMLEANDSTTVITLKEKNIRLKAPVTASRLYNDVPIAFQLRKNEYAHFAVISRQLQHIHWFHLKLKRPQQPISRAINGMQCEHH